MTHTWPYLPECPSRVQEGETNSCLALLVHQILASKVQPLTQPLLHHHFCRSHHMGALSEVMRAPNLFRMVTMGIQGFDPTRTCRIASVSPLGPCSYQQGLQHHAGVP